MTDPPGSLQSFRYEGALMNRMLIAGAGIVAFLSGASGAWAFTTQPVNPETMSNRLADPDELADKMSNGQSGGTTFGLPGNLRLQFSAPPSSGTANSPFVTSPSTVFVPSEHLRNAESPFPSGAGRAACIYRPRPGVRGTASRAALPATILSVSTKFLAPRGRLPVRAEAR